MFARLFLLFSIVPFIELFLLLTVGREVGIVPTVLMIVLTAVIGAALARREGFRVFREWQRAVSEMRVPEEGITSGLLVLVGGALLIAPGVLTDIIGILLMIAPVRRVVARWIEARVKKHIDASREAERAGVPFGAASASGPGFFTFRVVTGAPFAQPGMPPRARRVVPRRPQAVIEADGVVIDERRPDVPAKPDVIEGEIVE